MSSRRDKPDAGLTLRRWSARKLEAARAKNAQPPAPEAPRAEPVAAQAAPTQAPTPAPLPDVQTLTFESDFTAFLQPKVAEGLKRQALKRLFADPHFNVMDGLDVYIDDYSKPTPLAPELVKELAHARFTLEPPRTRINAQGHAEDVPPEELTSPETGEAAPPEADPTA